jgi:hypothetical protein
VLEYDRERHYVNRYVVITIVIVILSCVAYAASFSFPGFQGHVLDKESGKPIENAYVVCFTDYYSFGQQINPGGGNAHPDELQVAITDKNGFFKIDPYRKYSGGWADVRDVYIFREGYLYASQYVQLAEKKNVLRTNSDILSPSDEISLNAPIIIYLSSKDRNNIDGSPLINGFRGLLYRSRRYYNYFKYSNRAAHKRLKPYFLELYRIADKYSNEIQKTFPEPHIVRNWNNDLSRFREDLRDDLNRNGER